MPSPSFTYTLTNGTTADADQVMQNFDDILNGVTDGTKDLSIAALTVAGTATFNGNVTLGNATADDITITGSLASTIPIKTDASFDIGSSSLGLRTLYFGGNSNRVGIKASASTSATWNLTLPTTAGTSGYQLITDGSGNTSWGTYSISSEADIGALTWSGSAPSGTAVKRYRWIRDRNKVTAFFNIEYSSTAASNNFVYFTMPADLPTPRTFTGVTGIMLYAGPGGFLGSLGAIMQAGFTAIYKSGSTYRIYIGNYTAANTVGAVGSVTYDTDA